MLKILLRKSLYIALLFPTISYATGAWLPGEGSYKASMTFMVMDNSGLKARRIRENIDRAIERQKVMLEDHEQQILARIHNERRVMRNSEKHILDMIRKEVSRLRNMQQYYNSFKMKRYYEFSVEQGITDKYSIGANYSYQVDQFSSQNTSLSKIEFFYHQLLYDKNYVVSYAPKFSISNDHTHSVGIGLMYGHAKDVKNGKSFLQAGEITVHRDIMGKMSFQTLPRGQISYSSGIRFNDIILNNYVGYYIDNNLRNANRRKIFDEISLIQEIKLAKDARKGFAIKIGYFWDRSLVLKTIINSGLIFSSYIVI
jgi:hypothetical protein